MLRQALDLNTFIGWGKRASRRLAIGDILAERRQWSEAVAAYEQAEVIAPTFTAQRQLALAMSAARRQRRCCRGLPARQHEHKT